MRPRRTVKSGMSEESEKLAEGTLISHLLELRNRLMRAFAAVLLIFAMVFDTLDGRVARMTKTQSAFGVQIDSLADVTSFGVAPALLVQKFAGPYHPTAALVASSLFVMCGAIRLARFNVLSTNAAGVPRWMLRGIWSSSTSEGSELTTNTT